MPKPTAVDALNDALGLTGDEPGTDAAGNVVSDEGDGDGDLGDGDSDAGEGDAEGDLGEEGDGDAEEGAGEEGDEPAEEGEGQPRAKDGKFAKPGEKPGKDGKDGKPDDKNKQQQGEPKKPDAINDPIPKDLKQETRERMQTLINTARELTTERDTVQKDFGTFVGGLQAAGVSPEQYGETLSWLGMFNSGDPQQQEKALDLIEGIADRLATMLGKERKLNDPLSGHPDLVQLVQQGKATREVAAEVARHRNSQGFNRQLQQNASTQQQQQQQQQEALTTARNELHQLEETLRATDPQYERKKQILVAALKPTMKKIHPSQWKQTFLEAYQSIKVPGGNPQGNGNGQRRVGNGVPKNQPMRAGKQPAGGAAREATSALDAMNGALSNMK
jgi:hypothetical protein